MKLASNLLEPAITLRRCRAFHLVAKKQHQIFLGETALLTQATAQLNATVSRISSLQQEKNLLQQQLKVISADNSQLADYRSGMRQQLQKNESILRQELISRMELLQITNQAKSRAALAFRTQSIVNSIRRQTVRYLKRGREIRLEICE